MSMPTYDDLLSLAYELKAAAPETIPSLQSRADDLLSGAPKSPGTYLESDRHEEAEAVYMTADIGDVVDAGGWEFTSPGNTMSRPVFLSSDTPGDPTIKRMFAVGFADGSASVESATLDGEDVMPALRLRSDDSPSM